MNNNHFRLKIALTLVLCITAQQIAGAQDLSSPVTLAYKFTAGAVRHYAITMDLANQLTSNGSTRQVEIHYDDSMTVTVQSVNSDGSATELIALTTNDGSQNGISLQPSSLASASPAPMTLIVSKTGQVLGSTVAGGSLPTMGAVNPGSLGFIAFLPSDPVSVGDSWSGALMLTGMALTINHADQLISLTNSSLGPIAEIETKYHSSGTPIVSPSSAQTMKPAISGNFLLGFDVNAGAINNLDGHLITDIKTNAVTASGQPAPTIHVDLHMKMALLP